VQLLDLVFRRPAADELADDEWDREYMAEHRRREQLLASGEMEADEAVSGISEVHWAARKPRVTSAAPTAPGFYAQRRLGTQQWGIVEVVAGPDGALWWAWGPREPAVRVDDVRTFGRFEWSDAPYALPVEAKP